MKVLLTGASGLLGSNLASDLGAASELHLVTHSNPMALPGATAHRADLSVAAEVRSLLDAVRPDVIVHAAALTNVDLCEEQPELAKQQNVEPTRYLAEWAAGNDSYLIHISTDGVFDGELGQYKETDQARPLNWYGKTKRQAEDMVLDADCGVVLRTNIFGWGRVRRGGLAEWVITSARTKGEVGLFRDATFNPLWAADVAPVLMAVMKHRPLGLYHIGSSGGMTKLEFGTRLLDALAIPAVIHDIQLADIPFRARRPRNTTLAVERFQTDLRIALPNLDDAIVRFAHSLRNLT